MPEPILVLYSLGIAPFFYGFLSNLLDTIALPTKHTLPHHPLLHNQPSFDQQLAFLADHEHFYFLSIDPYYYDDTRLEHGQTAVGLRLPKLPILLTALWAIISSRQFQTFIPTMFEERTIPM